MEAKKEGVSRRAFMKGAMAAGGLTILGAAARGDAVKTYKAALIGCGGRGNGAAKNIIEAGKTLNVDIRFVAVADAYADRAEGAMGSLNKAGQEIPKDRCFAGFDGYKKVLDTDAEIVLMATSPNFRPIHFEAAVKAGKHCFIEKPVGVDPVGCRRVREAGKLAEQKGLAVLSGLCLRHSADFRGLHDVVASGEIGPVLGGTIYYCIGRLWYRDRAPQWSDAEYLVRNWVSFTEMSGDHICEQHVHTIDALNWCMGGPPEAAIAIGARLRRKTGDQYDCFATDFTYPGRVHVTSLCRQVNGCWSWGNGLDLVTEKGWANSNSGGSLRDGNRKVAPPEVKLHPNMYVQEHIVLLQSLLDGKPVNDSGFVADSTLTAVMARISAYTGQKVEWKHLVDPNAKSPWYDLALKPSPEDFETGNVKVPEEAAPVPGKD